jgi:ATPase subunit of ABC transporter with duplicated ATPase domains
MLTVTSLGLQFGKRVLFDDVNIKFTRGNCYGVIGANGAGKSTFLKILAGDIDPTRGSVALDKGNRMAVLRQNHFEFEDFEVLDTVIMGHRQMYDLINEKNAIYADPEATQEDYLRAAEMEEKFGEMGGWTAESDAAGLLSNLGVTEDLHHRKVGELSGANKVKVLLAQALFGNPDILVLDEPTNDLDPRSVAWLADFLADFPNTVITVSHDRYFLDMVCTHIVDIDFMQIKLFSGNYTFWYEMSQLLQRQAAQKNKKMEQQREELQEFIRRFSANASKSKQATSRKKALEKLQFEDLPHSSRKYPYINFTPAREPGDQIVKVDNLGLKNEEGQWLFKDVSFSMMRGDKIGLLGKDSVQVTAFFDVMAGSIQPTEGSIQIGQTITVDYLPNDNSEYFKDELDLNLVDWLREFSKEKDEQFIRGFLGRMLFKGEEVYKKSSVLSGGEKVRCMLSKIMLSAPNFLLLDEPTNHLDLESVTVLNTAMKEFPGCMIYTSHDFEVMNSVGNRILELKDKGCIDKMCNFEDYLKQVGRPA